MAERSPKKSALKPKGGGAAASTSNSIDNLGERDGIADATSSPEMKNDGAEDTITVLAHVREKIIPVHCGFGTQQVVWIGHVAIARYDEERRQGWLELGVPTKITKTSGKHEQPLQLTDLICDVLQHNTHVYISSSLG
ncbi:hypothetical protein PybrP1_011127 [[Pythium] brassicae (nom. inval.)]|nr:hypothetical protein PybrP1_011127 [[Pythium] brassicae (nom. inval.)]